MSCEEYARSNSASESLNCLSIIALYLVGSIGVIGLLGGQLGRSIFPVVDAGQFRLRMRAPEGSMLRPGMFATATILLDQRESVLVLPIGAIVSDADKSYCWTVDSGKLDRRQIQLGLRSGGEVAVIQPKE